MNIIAEDRRSDSPFIKTVWRAHSESAGSFTSIAAINWEIVVMKHQGRTTLTLRGPETEATRADFPAGVEWSGITFHLGVYMPYLPPKILLDRRDATLPEAASQSFWLNGSVWQFPDYENAETFVARLVRENLLVRDPITEAAYQGKLRTGSLRSIQRHFPQATGLSHNTIHQIERARYATTLLKQGVTILDTVEKAGYFDQPHLTRALKHFIGQTPAQIVQPGKPDPLSFLYKTTSFGQDKI